LCANGFDAFVLHGRPGFRPAWLSFDAPRLYRGETSLRLSPDDLLIVPEVHAAEQAALQLSRRRIVFVQASSYVAPGLGNARDYGQLGYEGAIATMPHVSRILERHYGVEAPVIPPCVAPCFFATEAEWKKEPRKREVVLCPKPWCRDYPIVRQVLLAHARELGWRVRELSGKPHRQVARAFRRAAIHINVNCQESFNATVPEAMAAGCIPICYEAFGGRDFLRNRKNAYVFPTHHAYPLLEHALDLMASWSSRRHEIESIRRGAGATAARYTEAATEAALVRYFAERILRKKRRNAHSE
jgi:glycosyltransferase involved in cell wall biosynthesis